MIGTRLPVIPVKGDEKWEPLSKIVDKRLELRGLLRIEEKVKLRSVYNFMAEFEAEQFINFVFQFLT